jgi:low temperature requirement protein LtrA
VGDEGTVRQFKQWFWRPPRAHGDIIRDRSVSFLELLYDLVYAAVIAQTALPLAQEVSLRGSFEFAVVFALTWIAWINGSLYLELHGREDGRTRSFVFVQMGILALVAVFAPTAAADGGTKFAIVYVAFLLVQALMWNSVRRADTREVGRVTIQYVVALLGMAALIGVSVFLPQDARLSLWAITILAWITAMVILGTRSRSFRLNVVPTHSMVERFGTFVIIVLGEVVFGVVEGLSHGEQDLVTIGAGVLALGIGLGFWWIYFDIVGRRLPREGGRSLGTWIIGHLPITLAIAATGAAMVSLIEHAHESVTPQATSWLLGGSLAIVLLTEIVVARVLVDRDKYPQAYRYISLVMAVGAAAALALGLLQPQPLVLAAAMGAMLIVLWIVVVAKFIAEGAWPPP